MTKWPFQDSKWKMVHAAEGQKPISYRKRETEPTEGTGLLERPTKSKDYRAFFPVCREVLKMMFWEIPPADWLLVDLPTAQAGPHN